RELVFAFLVTEVPVIALAALVVVSNTALARRTEVQPILEPVPARRQRRGKLPDHDLHDRAIVPDFLGVHEENGTSVLHPSNIASRCPCSAKADPMAVAPPGPWHQRPSPSAGITRISSISPPGTGAGRASGSRRPAALLPGSTPTPR